MQPVGDQGRRRRAGGQRDAGQFAPTASPTNISGADLAFLVDLHDELQRLGLTAKSADAASIFALVDRRYREVIKPAFPIDGYRQALKQVLLDCPGLAQIDVPDTIDNKLDTIGYLMFRPSPVGVIWRIYVDTTVEHGPHVLRHVLLTSPVHCKIGRHPVVSEGRDALVLYPTTPGERDQALATLSTYIQAHPTHVLDQPVRFTVSTAPGLSHVQDPQNMAAAWATEADTWLRHLAGNGSATEAIEAQNRTFCDERSYAMSWSELVSELIARAYRTTTSVETFIDAVSQGLRDIGFDHTTGAIAAPTQHGLYWLLDRFFPPT